MALSSQRYSRVLMASLMSILHTLILRGTCGTNKKHSGLIWRSILKRSKMCHVSHVHVKRIENWMNQLPRNELSYKTLFLLGG